MSKAKTVKKDAKPRTNKRKADVVVKAREIHPRNLRKMAEARAQGRA